MYDDDSRAASSGLSDAAPTLAATLDTDAPGAPTLGGRFGDGDAESEEALRERRRRWTLSTGERGSRGMGAALT